MKKRILMITLLIVLSVFIVVGIVSAFEDGENFLRNVSQTPDEESENAGIGLMNFYVPAQFANGSPAAPLTYYYTGTETTDPYTMTRDYAKPLLAVYVDGVSSGDSIGGALDSIDPLETINSGFSLGQRDTFVALSLDDGASWKRTNLSNSALLSSFTLLNGNPFPGDSYESVIWVEGDRVLGAWASRYCLGGNPAYAMLSDEDLDGDGELNDPLYPDYFGVKGNQKSIDYETLGFPEIGEVPYGCVWTARGQLLYYDDPEDPEDIPYYDILWTKAERLTSGTRDPYRLEISGAGEAGFSIIWQEDPKGIRPGLGLGPGEGWSGAIVNAQTDLWYSYIGWDDFDLVYYDNPVTAETEVLPIDEYPLTTRPQAAVPMAMPVRITDNAMCQIAGLEANIPPYCFTDFSTDPPTVYTKDDFYPENDFMTFCSDIVTWYLDDYTNPKTICATQDGRLLMGRIGASRPRFSMHPYTYEIVDGEGITTTKTSAWVVLGYEESKALGEGEDVVTVVDIGKDMWYESFDMFKPNIISHGNILNQPAQDPRTGEFFPVRNSEEVLIVVPGPSGEDYSFDFYETEISRRFSLLAQDIEFAGPAGLVALPTFKVGIINQGGPADVFGRQIVIPDDYNPAVDNPYTFENMVCENWAYDPKVDYNPYYPKGICLDPLINITGTDPVLCWDGANNPVACPTLEEVYSCELIGDPPVEECSFDLDLFTRVVEWDQTEENLTDQVWENPFDVSKGHRGFLDGDFVMILYAWSPNYKLNAIGGDHYNLYIRRSFDGGTTWTTLPADYEHIDQYLYEGDGTTTCENFGWPRSGLEGEGVYQVCTDYGSGEFEKARNVSQLVGAKVTILDPRYTPSMPSKSVTTKMMDQGVLVDCTTEESVCPEALPYIDDGEHMPSNYFIVYETGDNTTVTEGEATPMDLFYSRATNFGDDYGVEVVCYEDPSPWAGLCLETWDWLEKGAPESGEASITANAFGTFLYAVWNQALEIGDELFTDMDIYFRRAMYELPITLRPVAEIIDVNPAEPHEGETITITGYAYDRDEKGEGDPIVAYEWTLNGVVLEGEDDSTLILTSLEAGTYTITLRALDNDGEWSAYNRVVIEVLPRTSYEVFLPMISFSDTVAPELTITGATDNDELMDGNLETGYILETTNVPTIDHLIQFYTGTVASEPLEAAHFGLYLVDSTVTTETLKTYYENRGTPDPFLTYLKDAVDGIEPFVYIDGSTVTLVDAAKYDLLGETHDMTVPDDYPLGTYTVEGVIRDLVGNETTVTLILKVVDGLAPELTITGATDNGELMDGDLETGYILETTNISTTDHLIQFYTGTVASEPLEAAHFGLYLVDSTVTTDTLKTYYENRGTPDPFLAYLKDAVDGIEPFVYIDGSTVTLVDAAKYDLLTETHDMTVPDDYPLGTYTVEGVIRDLAGNETMITLILIVSGDRVAPELTITGATDNSELMDGDLETGYILETTNVPSLDHLIQFYTGTVASEPLEAAHFGLYLVDSTVTTETLKTYYENRGTPDPFLAYLKDAVDGIEPFVYIDGSTVTLVDAAKYDLLTETHDMTVPDDYPLGTYTVEGVVRDLAGNETTVTLILIVSGEQTGNEEGDLVSTTPRGFQEMAFDRPSFQFRPL